MRIYLVRHTEYVNPGNVFAFFLPYYLSDEGRGKADRIGVWFVKNGRSGIPVYTSPVARCVQTSEIIASRTGSFVKTDIRLTEVACPNLEGKPQPDKSWLVEEDDPSREPRDAVRTRMLDILQEKIREGNDCIFVSHGEGLTILYYYLQNKELPKYLWDPANFPNDVMRGEVVELEVTNGQASVVGKFTDF